jgi:PST family polysaccharide transporter
MTAPAKSYGEILRSSAMIGGSQVVVIAIGIVRTKAMAVLLGPAGFGLLALFNSIVDLAASLASLGVDRSGVRQIAESVGSGDEARIARTAAVLRRISVLLGVVGALALVAASPIVSRVTFGTDGYAWGVALLGLAVLFRVVAGGQAALIQGLRRISDLAMLGIVGALLGTALSIALVYLLGEHGIAPSLVAVAAATLAASWWYSRRVRTGAPGLPGAVLREESLALVKLGFAFMASGFLMMGAAYAVRTMVIRLDGLEAAGFYQAAWTLGGLYVGMVLQAMGADFYPRLTAVIGDHATVNRLVNEQTRVSLLLAGPGVIATLALAPYLMTLFYSSEFAAATDVLRWFCLGMTLRVITWPIGYIIVAKGLQGIFFATELAWAAFNVVISWYCIQRFGVVGAGIAFLLSYLFHGVMIFPIVHHLTGFAWTRTNLLTGAVCIGLVGLTFAAERWLAGGQALGVGLLMLVVSGVASLYVLASLVPAEELPRPLRRLPGLLPGLAQRSNGSR